MKKTYGFKEIRKNTWIKKTVWILDREDWVTIAITVLVLGYVTVRCLID